MVDNTPQGARNLGLGIAAGTLVAVTGALAWALVVKLTHYKFGILASALGALIGFTVWRASGKQVSKTGGAVAAVLALLSSLAGKYLGLAFILQDRFAKTGETLSWPNYTRIFFTQPTDVFDPLDFLFFGLAGYAAWRLAMKARPTAAVDTATTAGAGQLGADPVPATTTVRLNVDPKWLRTMTRVGIAFVILLTFPGIMVLAAVPKEWVVGILLLALDGLFAAWMFPALRRVGQHHFLEVGISSLTYAKNRRKTVVVPYAEVRKISLVVEPTAGRTAALAGGGLLGGAIGGALAGSMTSSRVSPGRPIAQLVLKVEGKRLPRRFNISALDKEARKALPTTLQGRGLPEASIIAR